MVAANPKDEATMVLSGHIRLSDFTRALSGFDHLMTALRHDYDRNADIDWMVSNLEANVKAEFTLRTIASTRGVWHTPDELVGVERVVTEYETVGALTQQRRPLDRYSKAVQLAAERIAEIPNGHVRSLTFQTVERDVELLTPSLAVGLAPSPYKARPYSFGAVRGRVESMSRRAGLRFTLYDAIYDLPVSCYLRKDQEHELAKLWDKTVVVEGEIRRDASSGDPTVIRNVTAIEVLEHADTWNFERARGAVPWMKGEPRPQDVLRRLRNA